MPGTPLIILLLVISSCSFTNVQRAREERAVEETLSLAKEVKEFEKSLEIEPSESLVRSAREKPPHSMFWLWLQRRGTIAVTAPVDVIVGLGFSAAKEQLPETTLYDVRGYSVYFRRENQFGDAASVITEDFARDSVLRRVEVILHEDLHDDRNFALAWENEESIVTPVSVLAAAEFFARKGDTAKTGMIWAAIGEKRSLSKEINRLAREALDIFQTVQPIEKAKDQIVKAISESGRYAAYRRYFERGLKDQNRVFALEAKLSHDLAYYGHFDRIVSLYELKRDLRALIGELKKIPRDATREALENYLTGLQAEYESGLR